MATTATVNAVAKKMLALRKRSSSSLVGSLAEIIDDSWLVGFNPTNLGHSDKFLFLDIFDPNSTDEDGSYLGEQIFCPKDLGDDIRLALAEHSEEEIISALAEKKVSQSSRTGAFWFSEGTRLPSTTFGATKASGSKFSLSDLLAY